MLYRISGERNSCPCSLQSTSLAGADRADVSSAGAASSARRMVSWACRELGLGNLIRSAQLNFKEVRFFLTAAVMQREGVIHESVPALMRWILADSGMTLPGDRP
jgi:hypothetical protein